MNSLKRNNIAKLGKMSILVGSFLGVGVSTTLYAQEMIIGFMDEAFERVDVSGTLLGTVQFAQSHTIDPAGNSAKEMPTLVTERDALVMFTPIWAMQNVNAVTVTALMNNVPLGELVMASPDQFPASDQIKVDDRPSVVYSTRAWSVKLPWNWLKTGLSLQFKTTDGRIGTLAANKIDFSGASEVVLQNIRIGMLTDPPGNGDNLMERDTGNFAIDYFQKIPVSRLTIGQYLPVKFPTVVMSNGTIYTKSSATEGGVYDGDMREDIGKSLVSTGINLANYGISSSQGGAQENLAYFREVAIHQSVGVYTNGIQSHGLSGGGGIATLWSVNGNEFSHELGHNWDLGHYPGGSAGSVHSQNSGWGYNGYLNRMIGNVDWTSPANDVTINDVVTPPFKNLYSFGLDAMAGGYPMGKLSTLTHHTGYSAKLIQSSFVNTPVLRKESATGYAIWDNTRKLMVDYTSTHAKPTQFGVPVVTLIGYYDPLGKLPSTIYPALYGNLGNVYTSPAVNKSDCRLDVTTNAGVKSIKLLNTRVNEDVMNKIHVNIASNTRPSRAEVFCRVNGKVRSLDAMQIKPPSATLPAAVTIGREEGYQNVTLKRSSLLELVEKGPYTSIKLFEDALRDKVGKLLAWDARTNAQKGDLFVYQNPYSGKREYFMMLNTKAGDFPRNGKSNAAWRYMGCACNYVNLRPEPFSARKITGKTLEERIANYYGVPKLLTWQSVTTQGSPGEVYQSGASHFFMLKTPTYGAFPTNGKDNASWAVLPSRAEFESAFGLSAASETQKSLEARVINWWRIDRIHEWGENNNQGIVGQIFHYGINDTVYYFKLKKTRYWYFPVTPTSNEDWEFLGAL
jgi:hypothetical protein